VFDGVPMSSEQTGAAQRARLAELGLRTAGLPALRDVDTIEDAVAVARERPNTRFAAALRGLAPALGSGDHAAHEQQPVAEAAAGRRLEAPDLGG
jgi:hypothetical protein